MAVNTVATQALQDLDVDQIIDQNYDRMNAFLRAIKVFQKSCLHFNNFSPNTYQTVFDEFSQQMADLYNVNNQIAQLSQDWMQIITNQANSERVSIRLNGIKYIGDWVSSAQLSAILGTVSGQARNVTLNFAPDNLTELREGAEQEFSTQEFMQLIDENQEIEFRYEDNFWGGDRTDFPVIVLPYRRIHPEGCEQWIDFGNEIQILISIRFEAIEINPNAVEVMTFHLHSIYYMIERRLEVYRGLADTTTHIHRSSTDKQLSYIQSEIKDFTRELIWETTPDFNQDFVKYTDLQIGYKSGEEIEDQFCTCNEFCNLNAFFHYNPIYRFLLVQHNRLYIKNRTNIPNLYQLVLCAQSANQPQGAVEPTPLIRLLISVNYQRVINWNRNLTDQEFRNDITNSVPNIDMLLGTTYNWLAYKVPMADICIQTDRTPFGEQSLENINEINIIILELHQIIGTIPAFVTILNVKEWESEFELFYRNHLYKYLNWCYTETLNAPNPGSDYLFSEDFEYSSKFVKSEEEQQVIDFRNKILIPRDEPNGNPFNIRFECQQFTHSIRKYWEYFTKYEPNMSGVYISLALKDLNDFCKDLDKNFKRSTSRRNFTTNRVNCPQFPDNLEPIRDQMFVFYKLKVYFYAFGVQKYFCYSTINYSHKKKTTLRQAVLDFKHIWENLWIENIFQTLYPNQEILLFTSNFIPLHQMFNQFYDTFWGKAPYEVTQPSPAPNVIMSQVSIKYAQYNYWQQNNGDNRLKFTTILDEFNRYLNRVVNESQTVYQNHIISSYPTLKSLYETDDHFIEVVDELVYWLVKATGFMILRQITILLNNINRREVKDLVDDKQMFVLCKPGFVPFFRTKDPILQILDDLKVDYIVFDDNFNRISKAIGQTKAVAKELYKNYYRKLSNQWYDEIEDIFENSYRYSETTIKFHLINGLSFVAAFIDDYRKPSRYARRRLQYIRNLNLNTSATKVAFNETWDQCLVWLRDVDQIRLATPFVSPLFANYLENSFGPLMQSNQAHHDQWIADADQI